MASSAQGNIRKLLSQHTFEIDSASANEDLSCIKCKKLLNDAYQTYCSCNYCHDCIVEFLSNGPRICCGDKNECKEELLVVDENVNRSAALNRKILRTKVICPNESCTESTEVSLMEEHLQVCPIESLEYPYLSLGSDNVRVTNDTVVNYMQNETLVQNLSNDVRQLKEELRIVKETESILRKEFDDKISKIEKSVKEEKTSILAMQSKKNEETASVLRKEFNDKISKTEKSVKEATERGTRTMMDQLQKTIDTMNKRINTMVAIGETTFVVDRFHVRSRAKKEILSPYFYSHTNGYKLRLEVYPGGHDDGIGTHLSLFIRICKGEYDDLLPWPCKYSFDVSIDNQKTAKTHKSMTLRYDTSPDNCKCNFDKPINEDNVGHGYPTFMSLSDIRSIDGIIVNDSVSIKCIVRPTQVAAIGETTFVVDTFDALSRDKEGILSPYFYSHTNGYKLRLRVDPGGNGDGSGTHLTLGIRICKGEYDDLLPWPCKYSFDVSIDNQKTEMTHKSMTLSYDTATYKCNFDKPINKDNKAYGYPEFISLADIRSIDGIIVNDSVSIKCMVRPPPV